MKLEEAKQSREEMFNEFDLWITPSFFEIKDTDKYKEELSNTQLLFDLIGKSTNDFSNLKDITASKIVEAVLDEANKANLSKRTELIDNTASMLFLVTGKSDNNAKCQFPLFLRDVSHWEQLPHVRGEKLTKRSIPRTLKSTSLSKQIAKLKIDKDLQKQFFKEYVKFILDDPEYVRSFWSIGNSYFKMKKHGMHGEFLMPLVIFKVRGSVSASGGHDPEDYLREMLTSWGLVADYDFNTNDIVVGKKDNGRKTKTRAFDFVLPFNIPAWENHLFIQCQFYAGDSGSVSHKNVDQTRSSRNLTKEIISKPKPVFIEYLDGAGYYSSLNGDLRSILSMQDTDDFFQVRTAPIKLRRALQRIGFLTPLDFSHSLLINEFDLKASKETLKSEGYSKEEIDRCFEKSVTDGIFLNKNGKVEIDSDFEKTSRIYYLLDTIFNASDTLDDSKKTTGVILVPGINGISGIKLSELSTILSKNTNSVSQYYEKSKNLLGDLEILSNNGWIIQM